ncbi:ComF family protein [Salipiger mangrovisoli]|uniref:ComF family protein n=1 Tax=Salipiger mangrovisoli TaxID=2865933 RepID=A0ABR9WXI2_9RHOB|nr:double zinc ribbon domain-containing protein [Salipiger mangrovisoli]MBE9635975.1 ComF family protein [Salipiger mangrovisoli]
MRGALRLVYPPRCLICGGLVESDHGLCGPCWRDTPFLGGLCCDLCAAPLPGRSDAAEQCDACRAQERPWQKGRAALLYRDNGRKLVLMLKHGDRTDIAGPAARWMARDLRGLAEGALVVPVPLHLRRHLRRRYNQSALLGAALALELGLGHMPDALRRIRATPALDGKGREARFAVLDGAIQPSARGRTALAGRKVLLVDDVMTSGATLSAASRACIEAGATQVVVSVLARVAKDT